MQAKHGPHPTSNNTFYIGDLYIIAGTAVCGIFGGGNGSISSGSMLPWAVSRLIGAVGSFSALALLRVGTVTA